jgi:hypothetical protein
VRIWLGTVWCGWIRGDALIQGKSGAARGIIGKKWWKEEGICKESMSWLVGETGTATVGVRRKLYV